MYLSVSYTGIYSFIPLLFLLSLSQYIFHYEYILFKNISKSLSYSVLQQIAYFKDGYKHMPHAKRELFPAYLVFELKVRVLWTWKQRLFKSSATRRSYLHISLSDENVISTQSHIWLQSIIHKLWLQTKHPYLSFHYYLFITESTNTCNYKPRLCSDICPHLAVTRNILYSGIQLMPRPPHFS